MISVDTTFASPSATRLVSGATLTNNMKCVSNNIHNFILLPSFVLSFIHSYICIDPLLQIRCFRCGMNSYHKIAYEQFKKNWRDSFLTTSSIKTENTMWTLSSYIIRGLYCKRSYIVYMQPVASDRYTKTCCSTNLSEKERSITSLCICS